MTDLDLGAAVLFQGGKTRASVLEGFTLTEGKGLGGVTISGSSPTLRKLVITGNKVAAGGGGVYGEAGGGGVYGEDPTADDLGECAGALDRC